MSDSPSCTSLPEPTAATTPPRVSHSEKRIEIFATALLAFAALATAWSSYQGSLWDGNQSSSYSQASAARTAASQRGTEANQYRLADLSVFENYIDASLNGNTKVGNFYQTRFRPEFRPAFKAWVALDPKNNPKAPATPLAMPEYQLASQHEADELAKRADELFAEGELANHISDVYTASTLFFAAALFFSAISERFDYQRARFTLLGLACVGLVAGVVVTLTQPITWG